MGLWVEYPQTPPGVLNGKWKVQQTLLAIFIDLVLQAKHI